jgi:hypothetical protein
MGEVMGQQDTSNAGAGAGILTITLKTFLAVLTKFNKCTVCNAATTGFKSTEVH